MLEKLTERVVLPFNADAIARGGDALAQYIHTLLSVLQDNSHYEERRVLNWMLSIQNAGVVYFAAPNDVGVYPTNTMRLYVTGNVMYLQYYTGAAWTTISSTTLAGLFTIADAKLTSPSQIYLLNHDLFAGFVANEHIDHSAVSILTTAPLSGGGNITSSRTLVLSVFSTDLGVNVSNELYVKDAGIDHNSTTNYDANRHIDHTAVSISAGGILTGGGTIAANRTISLANAGIDHDATTNFVANEHIDHTAVSVLAGTGLSGGGTIDANRTLALSFLGLQNLTDPGADRVLFWDESENAFKWLSVGDSIAITATVLDAIQDIRTSASPTWAALNLTSTAPYEILTNNTAEDTDGGRETQLNFKGTQSGAEVTTLARIEIHHDGAVDDEKGELVISVNDGNDGNSPTERLKIDAAGNTYVGDGGATNYSQFEPDGTLVFNGAATVFNDANVGSLVLQTGGTLPGIVEILDNDGDATGIYTRGFAVGEQGSGAIEVPHDYKEGTNLTFHVHWGSNTAPAGGTDNVQFRLIYSLSRDSNTFPDSVQVDKEVAYTTQYNWIRTDWTAINGATAGIGGGVVKIGDQFQFTLSRIAASADEFGGEALVATIGFHYECDTCGSRTISAK